MFDVPFAIIMETIFGACWALSFGACGELSFGDIMKGKGKGLIFFNVACFVLSFLYMRWLIANA